MNIAALNLGGGTAAGTVPGGGTGVTSFTAYAPIFGGTTSTGPLQSGTVGTAGQVLTSNGAGALPTFQAASGGITGPGTTVVNRVVLWNSTTGGVVKDGDVGTNPSAGVSLIGGNITNTTSVPVTVSQTWNNSGLTATGFAINITDTSSNAASIIQGWQIAGTNVATVGKTGIFANSATGSSAAPNFRNISAATGLYTTATIVGLTIAGGAVAAFTTTTVALTASTSVWNGQAGGWFASQADFIGWSGRVLMYSSAATKIRHVSADAVHGCTFDYSTTGDVLLRNYDDSANLTVHCGAITSNSTIAASSTISTASGQNFGWAGLTLFKTAVDGNITFTNNAQNAFGLMQFGGTTSSFPAIKRSTSTLLVRLADDSADADITAARVISTNVVRLKGYTVATLPAGTVGDLAYVTDATAPLYNAALTGGGAVVVPVFYNGAAWVSH